MYTVYVALTTEEVGRWEEFGECYIEKLAVDLCRSPELVSQRTLVS